MWLVPKTDWKPSDCVNIADWNRVEEDTEYIAKFFEIALCYKAWGYDDFPTVAEINRIKNNINTLLNEVRLKMNTTKLQTFDYLQITEIESCLVGLYAQVKEMELSLRRCGTFTVGQTIYIPIGVVY